MPHLVPVGGAGVNNEAVGPTTGQKFGSPNLYSHAYNASMVFARTLTIVAVSLSSVQPVGAQNFAPQFDGAAAYAYLKQLCDLGPRYSGSTGMLKQQALLTKHFKGLGAKVHLQQFQVKRHPQTGQIVPMANMIVELHPGAAERILLCAHYDTRPLPDRDPDPSQRKSGVFLGANDGASGTAFWMEMAKHLLQPGRLGVDIVYFDAEEYVWDERRDKYFLGSEYFAEQYKSNPPGHRYMFGVLVDMVGDKRLNLLQERHSASWRDTRPLVKDIWATAKRLRARAFIDRVMATGVRDDHLPLNRVAQIPVCNIIDFQYPNSRNSFWHTTSDVPANCSAKSLDQVGDVLETWLSTRR